MEGVSINAFTVFGWLIILGLALFVVWKAILRVYLALLWFFRKVFSAFSRRRIPPSQPIAAEEGPVEVARVASWEEWRADRDAYVDGKINLDDFVRKWTGAAIMPKPPPPPKPWRNPNEPYYGCATSVMWVDPQDLIGRYEAFKASKPRYANVQYGSLMMPPGAVFPYDGNYGSGAFDTW